MLPDFDDYYDSPQPPIFTLVFDGHIDWTLYESDDEPHKNLNWAGFDDVAPFPDAVAYHFDVKRVGG